MKQCKDYCDCKLEYTMIVNRNTREKTIIYNER